RSPSLSRDRAVRHLRTDGAGAAVAAAGHLRRDRVAQDMNGAPTTTPTERLALAGAAIAFVAAPPFMSDWIVFLIGLALSKGLVGLGVVLMLRGGLISFGQALYFAIGAYAIGFMTRFGIHEALVTLPAAIAVSTLVAAVLGLLMTRFRGIYF